MEKGPVCQFIIVNMPANSGEMYIPRRVFGDLVANTCTLHNTRANYNSLIRLTVKYASIVVELNWCDTCILNVVIVCSIRPNYLTGSNMHRKIPPEKNH